SFWVPEFSQKQDVVPGIHPTLHITPDRIGTYPVICTELCGEGHALMRSRARVLSATGFAKWAKSGRAAGAPAPSAAGPGAALFTAQGCLRCPPLAAAGAPRPLAPALRQVPASPSR